MAIEWFPLRPQLGHRLINDNRASDGFPLSPDRKLTETSSEREGEGEKDDASQQDEESRDSGRGNERERETDDAQKSYDISMLAVAVRG